VTEHQDWRPRVDPGIVLYPFGWPRAFYLDNGSHFTGAPFKVVAQAHTGREEYAVGDAELLQEGFGRLMLSEDMDTDDKAEGRVL